MKHTEQQPTKSWYARTSAGDHQGLVIEEETGRNIAVTYDVKDMNKTAAAPSMLKALQHVQGHWNAAQEEGDQSFALDLATCPTCMQLVREAIDEATTNTSTK